MIIYGVAILAFCHLAGLIVGRLLGAAMGIDANIGGVGFAMLLLIFITGWLRAHGQLPEQSKNGILFWSAMYIPIVIAMASIQNVAAAVSGGVVAVVTGIAANIACLLLVPVLSRIGGVEPPLPATEGEKV
ncbi:malonate transporter subunit MadL [Hyphococcus lacteus]|uniref:Malonate transporter subunit MadL n=1 Tax=Hyphococcus lacteus TaxID=3143536 RepID=A0ABV3Z7G6_9PROT